MQQITSFYISGISSKWPYFVYLTPDATGEIRDNCWKHPSAKSQLYTVCKIFYFVMKFWRFNTRADRLRTTCSSQCHTDCCIWHYCYITSKLLFLLHYHPWFLFLPHFMFCCAVAVFYIRKEIFIFIKLSAPSQCISPSI